MQSVRTFMRWFTVSLPVILAVLSVTAASAAVPTISSLSPSSATAGGPAFTLTINGTNFDSSAIAMWGAIALPTTYKSATQLTATVGSVLIASPGTASVKVNDTGGMSGGATFTINPKPAITTSTLPNGQVGVVYSGAINVSGGGPKYAWTLNGAAVPTNGTAVAIGTSGLSASNTGTFTLALGGTPTTAGQVSFTVAAKDAVTGVSSSTATFYTTISPAGPTISSLSPASAVTFGPAFTLTVNGANFSGVTAAPVVKWNNAALTTTVVSAAKLTASVPASLIATAGTASITVTTANGTSAPFAFPIYPKVTITTSTLPNGQVGVQYSGAINVSGGGPKYAWTVNGTVLSTNGTAVAIGTSGLSASNTGGFTLSLGGTPTTSGQVSFTVAAKDTATGVSSGTVTFYIAVSPAKPTITSLNPTSAVTFGSAFTLTINGANYVSGTGATTANWNGSPLATNFVNAGQVTATVPSTLIAVAGTANITVTTTNGTSAPFAFPIYPKVTITTSTLPNGVVGTAYSGAINVSGGGPNYAWTVNGTAVPTNGTTVAIGTSGLNVRNTGGFTLSIGGTPTTAGQVSFSVAAKDTATGVSSGTVTFYIAVTAALALPPANPATLPSANLNQRYAGAIYASGGVGPTYSWWVNGLGISMPGLSVTLPNGLSATTADNNILVITGTPTTAAKVTFTATVEDSASHTVGPVTYSISVNSPPMSLPPAGNLATATVGQPYTGFINVSGGDVANYAWTVNGAAVPVNGTPVTVSDGIKVWNTGGFTLSIGGTPTTSGSVPLSVSVKDVAPNTTVGPVQYAIPVNPAPGNTIKGKIDPMNNCGNNPAMPSINVALGTNPVMNTTTDSGGNFHFDNVPNGTYTITPSISGPSSIFYPATQSVTVNSGAPDTFFQVALGYTVSGTVTYSGSKTGRVYVELYNNNCGGGGGSSVGTSLPAAGAYTIHGVAPGNYTLNAWMDILGSGAANDVDPSSLVHGDGSVSLVGDNVTNATVAIADPPAVTLPAPSNLQGVFPFNQGAFVSFKPILNSRNIEMPSSYNLQWSTSNSFPTGTATVTRNFKAVGDHSNAWLATGLSGSQPLYFRYQGVAGANTSSWSAPFGPVTIGAPTAGNKVTGQVSFTGVAKGPLYVGFYDQNQGKVYLTQVGSQASPPASPASYTVYVPTGSNYFFFGVVDQNNDGLIDAGDIQNTDSNGAGSVSINGPATEILTLPSGNSLATVTTQHQRVINGSGSSDSYNLQFDVRAQNKLPVAVQIASGPHIVIPFDVGICVDCGHPFSYWLGIGNYAPVAGNGYTLNITYSDGTTEAVFAQVGAVLNAFVTNMAPSGSGVSLKPNFSWTPPANGGSYAYSFTLWDSNGNTIWQIPGNNSSSNGFSSSVKSIPWGVDPTGGGSLPSVSSLSAGGNYQWQIQAQDSNGNQASTNVNFQTKSGPLTLPPPNPSSLGPATVGQQYNGSISASGGTSYWFFKVNGTWITTQAPVNLPDGLVASNNGNQTLNISGTPTTSGAVTFTVSVTDNSGNGTTVGPYTYTIAVAKPAALSLPGSNSTTALVGVPFTQSLNASGGPGGGNYVFKVNGTKVPTNNTPLAIPNGDGLTATNSGGNTLFFAGTPTAPAAVTLNVSVSDTLNETAGPVAYTVNVVSGPDGSHDAYLKGRYDCLIQGFNDVDSSRWATISSVVADGLGNWSNGVFDTNSRHTSAATGTLSGSYSIGSDNTGLSTMSWALTSGGTASGKIHWALALTNAGEPASPAQQFRLVEVDDIGASPSGQHGTANCYLTTPAAFAAGTVSGSSFAFAMDGEGGGGTPKAVAGRFSASGGNITKGYMDQGKGGTATAQSQSFTGTYAAPDATTGRYTLALNASGTIVPMVAYIVDANRAFLLQTLTGEGVMAGNIRKQQQTSYSGANLNGPFVLYADGMEFNNSSSSTPTGYYSEVFQSTADGAGNMTVNASYMNDNGTYTSGQANGGPITLTFDPANPGRATLTPGDSTVYLYFFNNKNAFEMIVNNSGAIESGWAEPQIQPSTLPFTDAYIAGTYLFGQMPGMDSGAKGNVGEFALTAAGSVTGIVTTAGQGDFTWDQSLGMTYAWDSSTYGSYLLSGGGSKAGFSCIVINATKSACIIDTDSSATPLILQK
jgi:hypothetical protein